ncbi:metallophosphoesterase [Bradyrhizobium oligotrophicum]|uniref:metallophosphoesterase n=1 Tax=Bradyrhizobium oligotrophicum TaxID=44255 RepID=UPI003EBDF894
MLSRRRFLSFSGGLAATGFSTATYGVGIEPLRLGITDYQIHPRNWPAGLKLKIAAIADIHACDPWMSLAHIETIVQRTNALQPDLTVLLGDYVAGHRHHIGRIDAAAWAPVLGGLKAPLGVHAILGNHDYWDDRTVQRNGRGAPVAQQALEAAGIPVYENDVVRLTKGGHAFWLAGLGDQLAYMPARRIRSVPRIGVDDLAGTLRKVTDSAPVILLAHEPDVALRVPSRVSLQLSGHTHGGQVRVLGWSPAVPPRNGVNLAYGHIRTQCDVIVSGGLGCSIMPVRIGMPPEIVLVTVGGEPVEVMS